MVFEILPWHWVVFGLALMVSEIFLGTFFILWFGAAAVAIGGLLYLIPALSMTWQILLWTVLSSALAWGWFRYLKPLSIDRTKAGLSKEAITGEVGQVLVVPTAEKRGKLRFPAPVLGADEWVILSPDKLALGDRVRVVDISGNSLIVNKV
ncbi:MAG: NfeD family protein [Proteobacteria bacterium]|nr:MAG: NfeD family protein [Pseudomonadota bacterium]